MANYDDDLMEDAEETQPPQRVRSQVNAVRKQKGRGFREGMDVDDDRHAGRGYESLESGTGPGPAKCALVASACFLCPCWVLAGLVFPLQHVAVPCSWKPAQARKAAGCFGVWNLLMSCAASWLLDDLPPPAPQPWRAG